VIRHAPIRKRRGARRGPWRSVKFRRFIASLPCLICRAPGTQAAHTEHNGMASKGPDSSCVPLCPRHHDELDGRRQLSIGGIGKQDFLRLYQVDLKAAAAAYFRQWQLGKAVA
jgi:hypothetical protein